jgi:Family of unknown function (DUF5670)
MATGTVTVKSLVRRPIGRKLLGNPEPPEAGMLALAIVLLVCWFLGFAVFHVAGALIHLLLVVAVVVFIYRLITGRRAV